MTEKVNKEPSCAFNDDFKIIYSNVDCYLNKKEELYTQMDKLKPSIVCLNEIMSKTHQHINLKDFVIPGYDMFLNKTPKRGCVIHVHESLNAESCEILDNTDFEESVWCKFNSQSKEKVLVGCIYRSPNSSEENRLKLFDLLKSEELSKFDKVIIVGDFNFSSVSWDGTWTNEKDNEVVEAVRDAFLTQMIKKPTRSRVGQRSTMPDLLLVNDLKLVDEVYHYPPLGKSDHDTLVFKVNIMKDNLPQKSQYKFDLRKGDYDGLRKELKDVDLSQFCDMDVNTQWNSLKEIIYKGMQRYIPQVEMKKNQRLKPKWMDKHCMRQIKRKYNAYRRYLNSPDGEAYQKYILERNKAKKIIKKSKKRDEANIAGDAKKNPKRFWKFVQEKLKWNTGISALKKGNDELATSDKEKAEVLNDFFSSVFTREKLDNLPDVEHNNKIKDTYLQDIRITSHAVEKKLKELDPGKAQGPDKVPARVLKELSKELALPLTHLFNKSIEDGTIPDDWKAAEVVAIFKKGDKSDPGNYRPVSLTCIVCKLLESLVREVIVNYFEANDLYANCQHGFRQGRSCMTQLIEVIDDLTRLIDQHNKVDIIYLDFSKAFDSVPHERLLVKLESYRITGNVLQWIRHFLANRTQKVRVGSECSQSKEVLSGIPQGSILGPVLFTIYINDLPDCINSTCKIFADDTKLYNTTGQGDVIQADLDSLLEWSNKWNLYFNAKKCKVMHIGCNNPQNEYKMKVDGCSVSVVKCTEEKDLGVYFDCNLSFDRHIQQAITKSNQIIGMIKRSFSYLDESMFLTLYKSLVRPHLEYGNTIAYPYLKRQSASIERVQRRATKVLAACKDMTYTERLKYLGLPTLKARRLRGDMIMLFKIYHGLIDLDLDNLFMHAKIESTRNNEGKLFLTYSRTNKRKNVFTNRTISQWNSLPYKTKFANNTNEFKNLFDVDPKFIEKLSEFDN